MWISIRLAALLGVAALLGGCGALCDAVEQRTVTFSTDPTVQIVRPGDSLSLSMNGSLSSFDRNASFESIYRVVDDGVSLGQAIQISMGGRHPATDELVALTLVLPTPIRSSSVFTVDSAFQVPFDLPASGEGVHWAVVPTPSGGHARAAFRTGLYTFPPAAFTDTYVATQAAGTIRVTRQGGDGYQISIDLTFKDSAGRPASLRGSAQIISSSYTPSCIS